MFSGWLLLILAAVTADAPATQPGVTIEPVAAAPTPAPLTDDQPELGGMSGITWLGGNRYALAGDDGGGVYTVTVEVDPDTGRVTNRPAAATAFQHGRDLEAIAYDRKTKTLLIADEATTRIDRRTLEGQRTGGVAPPAVYRRHRANRGIESLAIGPDGTVYLANEEALPADGDEATAAAGSVVRVTAIDAEGETAGQWAYVTDPLSGTSPINRFESSGLVDLAVLPTGELIALEREFGGRVPKNRVRIYLVDTAAATDTRDLPRLAAAEYTAVAKTLLFELDHILDNYEGLCLGPELNDGRRLLLLVSDDNRGKQRQLLLPLRLTVEPQRPRDTEAIEEEELKPQMNTDKHR